MFAHPPPDCILCTEVRVIHTTYSTSYASLWRGKFGWPDEHSWRREVFKITGTTQIEPIRPP